MLNVVMRSKRGDVSSSYGAPRSSGLRPQQDQPPPGPMISPRHPNQDKFPAQVSVLTAYSYSGQKRKYTAFSFFSPSFFLFGNMMKGKTQIEQASTLHFRSRLISVEIQPTERIILFVLRRYFCHVEKFNLSDFRGCCVM